MTSTRQCAPPGAGSPVATDAGNSAVRQLYGETKTENVFSNTSGIIHHPNGLR